LAKGMGSAATLMAAGGMLPVCRRDPQVKKSSRLRFLSKMVKWQGEIDGPLV